MPAIKPEPAIDQEPRQQASQGSEQAALSDQQRPIQNVPPSWPEKSPTHSPSTEQALHPPTIRPQQPPLQDQQKASPGFWTAIFLMVCLIGGLGAFIASTYLPTTNNASAILVAAPTDTPLPVLSLQGPQVASMLQGQTLHLHGENFDAGAPIIFILDGTTAIGDTSGRQISLEASDVGSFDVAIPTSTWSLGEHLIQAENNRSGQSAYMNIQVMLKNAIPAAHADLGLSITSKLTFQAVVGQENPPEQFVTITNKNPGTPLQWTAIATTDNNVSWLEIDPATTGGTLSIRGKGTIGISVNTAGLQSNATAYTGEVVFIINQTEQLTLPVELQVRDAAAELVVSPNPLVGILVQDTCQANALLVLVNISNTSISWNLSMSDATKQHIQFIAAGESIPHGQLTPSGQNGNTQVLTLMCIHVQNGDTYHVLVNANNISWPVTVSIQAKL